LRGRTSFYTNYYQTVVFNTKSTIVEAKTLDESTGEEYISLVAKGAGTFVNPENHSVLSPEPSEDRDLSKAAVDLHFIPFYYRANRGGTGQMRVGLRRLK
jgi:uncharacterized protein